MIIEFVYHDFLRDRHLQQGKTNSAAPVKKRVTKKKVSKKTVRVKLLFSIVPLVVLMCGIIYKYVSLEIATKNNSEDIVKTQTALEEQIKRVDQKNMEEQNQTHEEVDTLCREMQEMKIELTEIKTLNAVYRERTEYLEVENLNLRRQFREEARFLQESANPQMSSYTVNGDRLNSSSIGNDPNSSTVLLGFSPDT